MIDPAYFMNAYFLKIYLFVTLCQKLDIDKIMEKLHKFTHNIFTDINIESDELANAIVFVLSRSKIRSYLASHEYSKEERYRIELDYSTFEKGTFYLNNMLVHANKSYVRNKRWVLSLKFLYPTKVSENEIKKFFDYCKQEHDSYQANNDKDGKISLYVWSGGSWKRKGQIPKRNSDTVIGGSSNSIVKDVMRYENSKTFYNTRQIPYKRGYILYGPPGTGKTTIIKMIASTFNKNIYKISIDESTTSLKSLISNVDCIYDNSILLIEDIDRLFSTDMDEDYSIMSDFLNLLDGLDSVYNCITFITTNNYELLRANFAPEFFRPGRIDVIKEVGYLSENEIIEYFLYFYSTDKNKEFLESSEIGKLPIADIKLENNINNYLKKCKGLNELLYNFVLIIFFMNKEDKKLEIDDIKVKQIIEEGLKEKKCFIEVYNTLLDLEKENKMDFYKNVILKSLGKYLADNIEENKKVTFAELQNYLLFFKKNPFDPILDINIKNFRYNNTNLISNDDYLEYVINLEKNTGGIENEKKKVIEYNAKEGQIIGVSDILTNIIKKIFAFSMHILNIIYKFISKIKKYYVTSEK
jgi:hypothetical protein